MDQSFFLGMMRWVFKLQIIRPNIAVLFLTFELRTCSFKILPQNKFFPQIHHPNKMLFPKITGRAFFVPKIRQVSSTRRFSCAQPAKRWCAARPALRASCDLSVSGWGCLEMVFWWNPTGMFFNQKFLRFMKPFWRGSRHCGSSHVFHVSGSPWTRRAASKMWSSWPRPTAWVRRWSGAPWTRMSGHWVKDELVSLGCFWLKDAEREFIFWVKE